MGVGFEVSQAMPSVSSLPCGSGCERSAMPAVIPMCHHHRLQLSEMASPVGGFLLGVYKGMAFCHSNGKVSTTHVQPRGAHNHKSIDQQV